MEHDNMEENEGFMKKELSSINDKIGRLGKMVETSMDHSTVGEFGSEGREVLQRNCLFAQTGRQNSQPN